MTFKPKTRFCNDCQRDEEDWEWCDLCLSVVCLFCQEAHDCSPIPEDDDDHYYPDDKDDDDFEDLFEDPKKPKPH